MLQKLSEPQRQQIDDLLRANYPTRGCAATQAAILDATGLSLRSDAVQQRARKLGLSVDSSAKARLKRQAYSRHYAGALPATDRAVCLLSDLANLTDAPLSSLARRAADEAWPYELRRKGGVKRRAFVAELLPEDLRAIVVERITDQARPRPKKGEVFPAPRLPINPAPWQSARARGEWRPWEFSQFYG